MHATRWVGWGGFHISKMYLLVGILGGHQLPTPLYMYIYDPGSHGHRPPQWDVFARVRVSAHPLMIESGIAMPWTVSDFLHAAQIRCFTFVRQQVFNTCELCNHCQFHLIVFQWLVLYLIDFELGNSILTNF